MQAGDGADRTFEHVYEYLPLDVPSARTIRKLAAFDGELRCRSCVRLGMLRGCVGVKLLRRLLVVLYSQSAANLRTTGGRGGGGSLPAAQISTIR